MVAMLMRTDGIQFVYAAIEMYAPHGIAFASTVGRAISVATYTLCIL